MSEIDTAKRKLNELKDLINPTIKRTFKENEAEIVDIQINKQLFDKGQDSKGVSIRPAYKPITIKLKKLKGDPIDRVTLRDTKRFHNSLIIEPKDDVLEITTSLEYAKYLFKKYGDNILGIQEELMKEFTIRYIVPNLKTTWNDKITKS